MCSMNALITLYLFGNVMNIHLIIIERKYGAIDDDDSTCQGYYIIRFSSSSFMLQAELNIDVQVFSSGEIIYEGTYYLPININSHYYVFPEKYTIVSLRKIINDIANVMCYYLNGVVPSSLI